MKKNILLLAMLFFLFSGCDFSIWEIKNKDEKKPIQKKNSISELKPKHRFAMPLEDVKNEKKAKETSKNIAKYNIEDIAEITEEVMKNYPFESKANGYKRNMEMIKQDFPKLTKEEFIANDSLITNYYDANLDYEVLQVLKKTKTPKKEKKEVKLNIKDLLKLKRDGGAYIRKDLRKLQTQRAKERKWCRENPIECHKRKIKFIQRYWNCDKKKEAECDRDDKWCIFQKVLGHIMGWGVTRQGLAIRDAYSVLANTHIGYKYKDRAQRKDVIRHLFFQFLLCKYYGGDMEARLAFAREIGNLWERIGDNYGDEMQMDYHNNTVGRNMYKNMVTYEERRFWFFWWHYYTVIISPSDSEMLQEAKRIADSDRAQNVPKEAKDKKLIINNEDKGFYYFDYDFYKRCYHRHWIIYFANKTETVYLKEEDR